MPVVVRLKPLVLLPALSTAVFEFARVVVPVLTESTKTLLLAAGALANKLTGPAGVGPWIVMLFALLPRLPPAAINEIAVAMTEAVPVAAVCVMLPVPWAFKFTELVLITTPFDVPLPKLMLPEPSAFIVKALVEEIVTLPFPEKPTVVSALLVVVVTDPPLRFSVVALAPALSNSSNCPEVGVMAIVPPFVEIEFDPPLTGSMSKRKAKPPPLNVMADEPVAAIAAPLVVKSTVGVLTVRDEPLPIV